ncbi:hypothetical protein [Ruficoccus sp. ZRK36]|uniref:hypothetical protein n=1 Tax=Ruficoccus sp. ZRK36 TaxID=2866311 RepID=UPI001C736F06|nr:hypothetical protein [Ruficoccus sp. ZRK36]QYY35729.1 hypothetical protein K0V07_15695 [Ruficoccus sp. ZRK36]
MKTSITLLALTACLLFAGCETRSISDSGYHHDRGYRGELNELSVLGVSTSGNEITEQEIADALKNGSPEVGLKHGDTIVLIQSGALFPDDGMLDGLKTAYEVIPLSGVPDNGNGPTWMRSDSKQEVPPLDKSLRLVAARGGASYMIVYWGQLEISQEAYATKAVSWIPIVGGVLLDEQQEMRIQLKIAIIDVLTGDWNLLTPVSYEDKTNTASYTRHSQHDDQVSLLKTQAYEEAVKDITQRYN